ncbi:choice-of-anchor A family protein [Kiritimatiellota bacterium B12222]|nr:choice-of-anchor A family protein [Kiritimatiellota bacterium B12222]
MKFLPLLLILGLVCLSPSAMADSLYLGEAQNFNAVIFGDLTAENADTEGRLAVGGNASIPSSYSVGHSVIGPQNPQSNGTRNDLVVKGDVTLPAGYVTVNFGNVQVGGSVSGTGVFSQLAPNASYSNVSNFENDIFNFTAVESMVRSYSSYWSTLSSSGSVTDLEYELQLSGSNPMLNVFNVTADEWATNGARYIDVPEGATTLINISGEMVTTVGGTVVFGTTPDTLKNPDDYRNNVIYNLYDATSIQSDYLLWEGSVFAPDATLTTTGGAINGQAFLGDVYQQEYFEFHNFGLEAEYIVIPEPRFYIPMIGLLTFCAIVFRRKR